jgi:low affinity Fe/Cu permease
MALHLKLNELIASNKFASNRLIDIEDLTEEELETIKNFYVKLSDLAQEEDDIKKTHSIEEATTIHHAKKRPMKSKTDKFQEKKKPVRPAEKR